MSALTSLLVRDEVVSVQQIEDALARTVLEGGEIDTALLELDAASENTLSSYRAASYGLPAATRETVMGASAEVIALVPAELARKYRVVPVLRQGHVLVLAIGQPISSSEVRAIQDAVGLGVHWCIATDVRIDAALARYYGIEISARMRSLAEQIDRLPAGQLIAVEPMLMSMPAAQGSSGLLGMLDDQDDGDTDTDAVAALAARAAVPLPPPTVVTERGAGDRAFARDPSVGMGRVVHVSQAPAHAAPMPPSAAQGERTQPMPQPAPLQLPAAGLPPLQRPVSGAPVQQHAVSMPPRNVSATPRPRPRRASAVPKGPLTVGVARELLDQAEDRDAVVEVVFSFARQYFDATALFALRDDRVLGLEANNMPAIADIREVAVSLDPKSSLGELAQSLAPRVVDLSRKPADQVFAQALDRMYDQPCALIPVCIRQRVVSVVYGDRRGEAFHLSELAELVELLPRVSQAFERIIRNRKTHAMQSRRPPPMAAGEGVQPSAAGNVVFPGTAPLPDERAERRMSTPAPRAAWSSSDTPAAVAPQRASLPPGAVAGVFPSDARGLRPHEVPTPAARPSRSNRPSNRPNRPQETLSGVPSSAPKHTPTARAMPSVGSQPPPPRGSADAQSQQARDALGLLGLPRSAPPPPSVAARPDALAPQAANQGSRATDEGEESELERSATMTLPAQHGQSPRASAPPSAASESGPVSEARPAAARWSKPPPGAGAYRSNAPEPPEPSQAPPIEHDTSPAFRSVGPVAAPFDPALDVSEPALDASEPPPNARAYRSRPPARGVKQPPGTGAYKSREVDREVVSLAPPPPAPAGRSSLPPSSYHSDRAPADAVAFPPPPRLPQEPEFRKKKSSEITQPLGPRRVSGPVEQPRQHEPPAATRVEAAAPHARRDTPMAADARRDEDSTSNPAPSAEVVRMSRAVRESIRPPSAAEPSIIVDTEAQLHQLVTDLCRCGPDDEARCVQQLLRFGEIALPLLAEHFPGPLWFDRRRAHPRLPLGRDVSAIARALSAFGERAVPVLQKLLVGPSADKRFYATLLVSDQVHPGLLLALAERLFDDDPQIRLIVRDTLPQYRRAQGFANVVSVLRERAADSSANMQERLAAIDGLATLRDPECVPLFIEQNASSDKQLSVPAHRALVSITGQDFGHATRKWQSWYDDHRQDHRAQWLIDSLMHADQAVRATAGIELQKLTQVYYGYVAAAPKRDRERAQKRYRDWWESEGKKRFG